MKICSKLCAVLSFLALYVCAGSYAIAAPTLEVTQKAQEISGIDRDSGVAFRATMPADEYVIIDTSVGTKQIHAEIDYKLRNLQIRSLSRTNGSLQALTPQDIIAFQKLRITLPPALNTATRHGDALTSFVNLMASAPPVAINLNITNGSFTPICNEIGGQGVAVYEDGNGIHHDTVGVGPHCYVPPATGRCGREGGPDFGIGWVQRFTQECLDHDQCCNAEGDRVSGFFNVCGAADTVDCRFEFQAAIPGFFFAPDCGTTAGTWQEDVPGPPPLPPIGSTWTIMGGDSSAFGGGQTTFSGTVPVFNGYGGCNGFNRTYSVTGTRNGTSVQFTAKNPVSQDAYCPASATFTGSFTDCNKANGSWTNSDGNNGMWSWKRTNTVGQGN